MRTIILSVLSCFFISAVTAQQFTASITDEYDRKREFYYSLKSGDRYLSLSTDWGFRGVTVELLLRETDKEGKTIFRQSAQKKKLKTPFRLSLERIGGRPFVIYQEMKGNTIGNVMAAEIDTILFEIKEPREITSIEKVGYSAKVSAEDPKNYKFYFAQSANQENTMIVLSEYKTASKVFVAVLDKDLNILWQKLEQLNADDNVVSIRDACTDANGNVYIAYRLFEGNKDKLPPKNLNHILVINKGKKIKDIGLDLGGVYSKNIKLLPSTVNNTVHFAGYYYQSDFQNIQGVYSGQININGFITQQFRKDAFPATMVTQLAKDGWATPAGIKSLLEPALLETGKGTLDLIAEFRTSVWGEKGHISFISGSIVNASIEQGGASFSWIPKYRVSAGTTSGDSFSSFLFDDKVIVYYNDNPDNLKKDITQPAGSSNNYKNVVLVGAIIQPDGSVTRTAVIDESDNNFMAATTRIERLDKNNFIVPFFHVRALGGFKDGGKLGSVQIK